MRRIFIIFSVVIGVIVVFPVASLVIRQLIFFIDPNAEVAAVQDCFSKIPGTKVTYISDLKKQASQCITAYLEVEGKGEMGFNGLSTTSFGHSSHVRLHGIGPYGFRTRELIDGREGYGYDIDVGTGSPIPGARKLGITSVQSAITHYDELLTLIVDWPVITNEWPRDWPAKTGQWSKSSDEEIHFPDSPRGDYYFCLKRQRDDDPMWPPNYPASTK
jgi:hypothetical protein